MAGNRKPKRKPGNRASVIDRADQSKFTRARDQVRREWAAIDRRNGLPMAHPENVHKLESVFGTIEDYLADQEATGESLVDKSGQPVIQDPVSGDYLQAGIAFKNQHIMFLMLAERFGWGEVPDGLRRLAAKLDNGVLLFESDMRDARIALTWMRERLVDITPYQWSETLDTLVFEEC